MSLPYFPMFPSDFEAKTSHLTLAEDGAYNRLLRICWMTPDCTIPADDAWIMRRARAFDDAEREAVRAVLSEFFTVEDGRYSNAKLSRIWREANEAHARRKSAGSMGGKARALKTNNSVSSNARDSLKQCSSNQNQNQNHTKEDTNVSLSPTGDAIPANEVSEAVAIYNAAAKHAGWPRVKKMTPARTKSLRARIKDCGGIEGWRDALRRAYASNFCREEWAGFGFDSLISQQKFIRLMEGIYDNNASTSHRISNRSENRSDPALEQIARLAGLSGGCDGR